MQISSFNKADTKQCPFCAEDIRPGALKCRFCGEYLNSELAKEAKSMIENSDTDREDQPSDSILFEGRPSLWALAPAIIKGAIVAGLALVLITQPIIIWFDKFLNLQLSDAQVITFGQYRVMAGIGLMVLVVLVVLLKTIKLKMTRYEVTADRIEYSRGILDRRIDNLDMFRVIDLRLRRSILDCIVGIGTVGLITTDKTDPEFTFEKIRRPRLLYDTIKKASLEADSKRSVIHIE